jgi:hypothetical protein
VVKLHELSPDQILAELEARSDLYVAAAEQEARAEAAHKQLEATLYKALRANGMSVKDAELGARVERSYQSSVEDLIGKQITSARTKAALERAKIAVELWRSIRADQRRV